MDALVKQLLRLNTDGLLTFGNVSQSDMMTDNQPEMAKTYGYRFLSNET